jgi:hypothetical protein
LISVDGFQIHPHYYHKKQQCLSDINRIVDEQQGKYFIRSTDNIDKSHGDL